MSGLERYNDDVWDRFFDHICDEEPTREQVQERLRASGIDIAPALKRVRQAIQESQARAKLEAARVSRPGLLEKFRGMVSPHAEQLRGDLQDMINRKFEGTARLAYFRKLEEAASEEDLQSLLDDLHRLEKLSEGE